MVKTEWQKLEVKKTHKVTLPVLCVCVCGKYKDVYSVMTEPTYLSSLSLENIDPPLYTFLTMGFARTI